MDTITTVASSIFYVCLDSNEVENLIKDDSGKDDSVTANVLERCNTYERIQKLPLPIGPAPSKPPRMFTYAPKDTLNVFNLNKLELSLSLTNLTSFNDGDNYTSKSFTMDEVATMLLNSMKTGTVWKCYVNEVLSSSKTMPALLDSNPVPVPALKEEDNLASHQQSNANVPESSPSASSSLSTSDFDSLNSTPTDNESKTFLSNNNNNGDSANDAINSVKDRILVFEKKSDVISVKLEPRKRGMITIVDAAYKEKLNGHIRNNIANFGDGHHQHQQHHNHQNHVEIAEDEANNKEISPEMEKRFRHYVQRVRSKIYKEPITRRSTTPLFHCCLLVGLNQSTPYVKSQYPTDVKVPDKIEELCFPDSKSTPSAGDTAQCYSLVITNAQGDRMFGYCRRVLPEGCETCLPLAYCILSPIRASGFYGKILAELESRHGLPDKIKNRLLHKLHRSPFPRPGECLKVDLRDIFYARNAEDSDKENNRRYGAPHNGSLTSNKCAITNVGSNNATSKDLNRMFSSSVNVSNEDVTTETTMTKTDQIVQPERKTSNSEMMVVEDDFPNEIVLARPVDSRYEDKDCSVLFNRLSVNILLQVFSSLLLERKVVLVGSQLSILSSCIEALQSMLYPFSWPHTLIPILPESLWEILEAPTPLLCGTLSSEVAQRCDFDNGIIVDLDTSAVVKSMGDECKILPTRLVQHFRNGLDLAKAMPSMDSSQNVLVGDAFIRVFVHSCGHYKDHIGNDHVFQRDSFFQDTKCSKSVRSFLKWFTETTMFHTFIESATRENSAFKMFDSKIQTYTSLESAPILKKMKNNANKEKKGYFS